MNIRKGPILFTDNICVGAAVIPLHLQCLEHAEKCETKISDALMKLPDRSSSKDPSMKSLEQKQLSSFPLV